MQEIASTPQLAVRGDPGIVRLTTLRGMAVEMLPTAGSVRVLVLSGPARARR